MKDKKMLFEEYKLLYNFYYDEPLKPWINEDNFENIFIKDLNILMECLCKLEAHFEVNSIAPVEGENHMYLCKIQGYYPDDDMVRYTDDNVIYTVYYALLNWLKLKNK